MQVFAEAGIDLGAMAAAGGGAGAGPGVGPGAASHRLAGRCSSCRPGKLWTPGDSHHQVVEMKNLRSGLPDITVRLCSPPLTQC